MDIKYLEKFEITENAKKTLRKFNELNYQSKLNFFENVIFRTLQRLATKSPLFDINVIKMYVWIKYDIIQITENRFNTYKHGGYQGNYKVYKTYRTTLTIQQVDELIHANWRELLKTKLHLHWSQTNMIPIHLYGMYGEYLEAIIMQSTFVPEYKLAEARAKSRSIRIYYNTPDINYDSTTNIPILNETNSVLLEYEYCSGLSVKHNHETYSITGPCAKFEPIYYTTISSVKEWLIGLMIYNKYDMIRGIQLPQNIHLRSDDYAPRLQYLKMSKLRFIKKQGIVIESCPDVENLKLGESTIFEYYRSHARMYGYVDDTKKNEIIDLLENIHSYSIDYVKSQLDSLDDYFILKVI